MNHILKDKLTACVATTVALTGTCLTVAAAVPSESVEPVPAWPSVTPLAPPTPLVAMVTVGRPWWYRDRLCNWGVCADWDQSDLFFWGITPRFGTIRIVVLALESDEVTVENVRVLGSAMVTAKAGMRRMVVSQVAFSSGWTSLEWPVLWQPGSQLSRMQRCSRQEVRLSWRHM